MDGDTPEFDTRDAPYRTIRTRGESELVVERSRFLGYALCVESVDEAEARVDELRSEHYDARHVCYGLRVGRGARAVDRSNDDGEPARTGGFPLWQLLDGEEITDALLVVVRYYGGVKLGTGGLARAYRQAGRLALDDAEIVRRYPEVQFAITIPYEREGSISYLLEEHEGVRTLETTYGAEVTRSLAVRRVALDDVRAQLAAALQRPPESFGPAPEEGEAESDEAEDEPGHRA
jgi:uncharacterized YigZ family protein